jgi:hypothetical protein
MNLISLRSIVVAGAVLAPLIAGGCVSTPIIAPRAEILRVASHGQDIELEYALAQGANIEAINANGCDLYPPDFHLAKSGNETPLICAAINGHASTVKMLLDAGANINAQDYTKKDALFYARTLRRTDVEQILRSKGAGGGLAYMTPPAITPAPTAPRAPLAPPAPTSIVSDVDKAGYLMPEDPDAYALVVGVEKYENLPAADYAERDAAAVRAHLLALGYPPRNIAYLTGAQGNYTNIKKYVESWLPNRVNAKSTVFVYYSGHGAPDPKSSEAYIVPYSGDPEYLEDTAYPVKRLYAKLGALKAKRVLVALDSCFSGSGGRSVLAKGIRPLVAKVDMGQVDGNIISLSASGGNEISGTIEEQGHGTFTYYLLKGLNGEAKDPAGAVTVQALYRYLTPKVQDAARLSNRDQTPQMFPDGVSREPAIRLR